MSKHTPGPWMVGEPDHNAQIRVLGPHSEICICLHHCVRSLEIEMEHNARLIAAAPEMADRIDELGKVVHYMRTEIDRLKTIMDDDGLAY